MCTTSTPPPSPAPALTWICPVAIGAIPGSFATTGGSGLSMSWVVDNQSTVISQPAASLSWMRLRDQRPGRATGAPLSSLSMQ